MKALIDGDILEYELAFGGQDRETKAPYSFESVRERLDQKIADIMDAAGADSNIIYLTGKGNFRLDVATVKEYKGNRKNAVKPFHAANVRAYLVSLGAIVVDGMEADDALAIEQMKYLELDSVFPVEGKTVICTRDKDLRQVPGWHYGWECGLQPEFAPLWVDEMGGLEMNCKRKLKGVGLMFFYSQILTGDTTDNIPGLKGCGDVAAYNLLKECKTEGEMYEAVYGAYKDKFLKGNPLGDASTVRFQILEQGQLLWMVRELDEEGKPVMWKLPC